MTYDAIRSMSDSDLERALYKQKDETVKSSSQNDLDYSYIHKELSKTGVTLRLLWEEYKKSQPDGYQYSHYCWLYQQWRGTLKIYMRQHHIAGERVYVDYSGKKPSTVNRFTGEITEVELFVMCWGYSHYTYAEAQPSQKQEHWITGHINGLNFFGCVPQIITPDNYKGAVTKAHRYDPDINHAYTELSEHYGFGVIPARSNSPKDKAKVECGVLIVQRWILARLRHQVFHNITELNIAVKTLLNDLNNRKMQRLNKTRKELFEEVDKPNARPLPSTPFSYRKHFGATVNLDYHVEIEKKYYSVPWQYCRKKVHCYVENEVVSIFYQEHRIAVHNELSKEHTFSTLTEHMPQQHRAVADWSVAFVLRKAKECGPSTEQLIRKVVAEKQHPQQGFRPSQGILRLADNYGKERLEAAAAIALQMGLTRVQQITNLLKNNKDIVTEQSTQTVENTSNIRGQIYYAQEEGTK